MLIFSYRIFDPLVLYKILYDGIGEPINLVFININPLMKALKNDKNVAQEIE
jgi:hypothetical protein